MLLLKELKEGRRKRNVLDPVLDKDATRPTVEAAQLREEFEIYRKMIRQKLKKEKKSGKDSQPTFQCI